MTISRIQLLTSLAILAAAAVLSAEGAAGGKVRIEGLRSIQMEEAEEWIATQLEFIESTEATMARADDAAYFLENALRERGYEEATVDWKLVDGANGGKVIVLTVFEGRDFDIGTISVSGNESLEDDAVVELLTSATRKRVGAGPDDTIPYVEADIDAGKKRVEEFYILLGFGDVEVDVTTDTSGAAANIAVSIIEGMAYKVGEITLPEAPDPAISAGYEKILEDFSDKSYSDAIPANLESRIRELAINAGFYDATATSTTTPGSAGVMNIAVSADWGEMVRVSGISVTGNEKVKGEFFDRHFEEIVGEPYSPDRTNKQVEELLQTGAFETVRTDIVEQPDGTFLLDVDVEEGYSRTLGVYAGFTNYEGGIGGFEFRNLNLLGSVRKVDAEVELSKRGARGELEFSDPWLFWTDIDFKAGIFAVNREEEGYEKFKTGGRYELSRKFGRKEKLNVAFFGEAAYTDVHDADIDPIFLGDRTYFAHASGLSLTYDQRDNPRAPRSGFIAQTSLSVASSAIGSEIEFLKATGRLGYYIPVGLHTLRFGARAGTISPMGDTTDIPIDLRFFNGGAQSVRSFQERSMGFRDPMSGDPIGGEFYSVYNIEYDIPVSAVEGLSVVPFVDAGNVIVDADNAGFDDLRYAVGLGIRYKTPIGPIRAEYGYNPDRRPGEPQGTFHVGFGFAY